MWESKSLNYPRYFCNWLSCLITNVSAQPIYSGAAFPCLSAAALPGAVFCFQEEKGEKDSKKDRESAQINLLCMFWF